MEALEGLNGAQKSAVVAEGHALVVAGPGTGKTLTMVRRIAYLVEGGTPPGAILALAFTNRAARELRERVQAFLGRRADGLFIGTFHLLGLHLLRSAGRDAVICTRDEQVELLKPLLGNSTRAAQRAAEQISRSKNCMEPMDPDTEACFRAYQAVLLQRRMCDFDDLISIPLTMFEQEQVPDRYRNFRQVIVDEYQDISPAQYRLLRSLAGRECAVCAVGDSDQAIYGFRGADVRNFFNFRTDFAGAETVVLNENYRSTGTIVAAADGVIRKNRERIEKELQPRREGGTRLTIVPVGDEKAEAAAIVAEIEARIGGTSHYRLETKGRPKDFSTSSYGFSDFAVLFRTHAQARVLQEVFSAWGLPCQVAGDRRVFNRKRLIEAIVVNGATPGDHCGLPEIVKGACEQAGCAAADEELLQHIAATYDGMPVPDAIRALVNELTLLTPGDTFNPAADAISLMTLHAAKGLEFRVVFITGVEEGLIPFRLGNEDPDTEEERRLFYVGMTRARDELFLLYTRSRFLYGQRLPTVPSPFLTEIPEGCTRTELLRDKGKKQKRGKQTELF